MPPYPLAPDLPRRYDSFSLVPFSNVSDLILFLFQTFTNLAAAAPQIVSWDHFFRVLGNYAEDYHVREKLSVVTTTLALTQVVLMFLQRSMQNIRGATVKMLSVDDENGLVAILNLTKQVRACKVQIAPMEGMACMLKVLFSRWLFAAKQPA